MATVTTAPAGVLFAFRVSTPVEAHDSSDEWRGDGHAVAAAVYCTGNDCCCAYCLAHYHGSYMDCHTMYCSGMAGKRCDWY